MLYVEIHQMYKRNFTVSQIAKQLKISRTTVYKYIDTTFEEVQGWFGMGLRAPSRDRTRVTTTFKRGHE